MLACILARCLVKQGTQKSGMVSLAIALAWAHLRGGPPRVRPLPCSAGTPGCSREAQEEKVRLCNPRPPPGLGTVPPLPQPPSAMGTVPAWEGNLPHGRVQRTPDGGQSPARRVPRGLLQGGIPAKSLTTDEVGAHEAPQTGHKREAHGGHPGCSHGCCPGNWKRTEGREEGLSQGPGVSLRSPSASQILLPRDRSTVGTLRQAASSSASPCQVLGSRTLQATLPALFNFILRQGLTKLPRLA